MLCRLHSLSCLPVLLSVQHLTLEGMYDSMWLDTSLPDSKTFLTVWIIICILSNMKNVALASFFSNAANTLSVFPLMDHHQM